MHLFQKSQSSRASVINLVPYSITEDDNDMLIATFNLEEFKHEAFFMQADKCPRSGGFNPGFYQYFWDNCGHEAYQAGCQWIASGAF